MAENKKVSEMPVVDLQSGDKIPIDRSGSPAVAIDLGAAMNLKIDSSEKGVTVATLEEGKVPISQLPSYVDEILEYSSYSNFPATGETTKIYLAIDTGLTYRWSGTQYVGISASLALGEIAGTAYEGSKGKNNADNIDAVELQTKGLTQIVATKDQQNLNQHNSMQKRLAVTEAETYNGSDLENYEPTNEVGIASDGTDISASVEDGSVELVTEGKSFENLVENGDVSVTVNGAGASRQVIYPDGSLVNRGDYSSDAQVFPLISGAKYYVVIRYTGQDPRAAANIGFEYESTTTQEETGTTTAGKLAHIFTASETGNANSYFIYDGGSVDTIKTSWMIIDLTALGLNTILDTTAKCDAYFNYVNGLASSLPHDVESVGVNLFDKTKVTLGYRLNNVGVGYVSATWFYTDYINVIGGENYSYNHGINTSEQVAFYDSNFTFIGIYGGAAGNRTTLAPTNARYMRHSNYITNLDDFQIEVGSSITPYQPYKSNHAHCPVTLNQVPTAKDTFNFKTGVHGVNTAKTEFNGTESWTDFRSDIGTENLYCRASISNIILMNNGYEIVGYVLGTNDLSSFKSGSISTDTGTVNTIGTNSTGTSIYITLENAYLTANYTLDLAGFKAYLVAHPITAIYELADTSKYTVQYPPQNLIAYKGGQISRIPILRDNGISTGGTVSLGTIPISRMGDVYEYIGTESSLVAPADITLAGDGLSFAVAGGGDNEVYDYVGYYDTAHSTYPVQQVQYTTDNVTSKLNDILFLKSPDENIWKLTLSVDNSGVVTVGSTAV